MKHSYGIKMSAALWAMLGVAGLAPVPAVAQGKDMGWSPARSSGQTLDAEPVWGKLDFDGPFAQLGIGFANGQSQLDFPDWLHVGVNDNSFVGEVAGGYSHSFGSFNLAASVFYTLGDQEAGHFTDSSYPTSVEIRLHNTWGVRVEPGFNLDESTLVYASLGYGGTNARYMEYDIKGIFPWEHRLGGFSFGAGLKYKFTRNIFGMVEIRHTSYQASSIDFGGVYLPASFKPSMFTGIVGVGYRF